ncbi:MAG TPA: hypothetical protein VGM03_03855 [Phycisphaerae bacterium]|jgi:hypothetical protein
MKVQRLVFTLMGIPLWLAAGGCGVFIGRMPDFSKTVERGANDQPLKLDDILAIINDNSLNAAQQRQMLRDLGIQDERLIDALVQ